MRIIQYDLLPEAYGSNYTFVSKEGTVANLIIDTGMLLTRSHLNLRRKNIQSWYNTWCPCHHQGCIERMNKYGS